MFNWFGRREKSKERAKDRLRFVLMQDRISLAPHTLERMKDDVIAAISKYVEIDGPGMEFSWKEFDNNKALVASIPIISVKRSVVVNDRTTQRTN